MSDKKYIDKEYLLQTLKDFDQDILSQKYSNRSQTYSIDPQTKHWFIGETDTGIIAEGQDGADGIQGIRGEKGEKGDAGTNGKDGKNAIINGLNTLIIKEGDNIKIDQNDNVLTISAFGSSFGSYPVSIEVITPPTKTKYKPGDTLDLSGMIIKAYYSDGSKSDITSECLTQPQNGTTLTNNVDCVTINWTWDTLDKVYSITLPLIMMVATSIKFSDFTEKTSYKAGETIDLNGTRVLACYPDGSEEDVTDTVTFTPLNGTIVYEDTTQITAKWTEPGTGAEYTVSNPIIVTRTLSSITVSAPTKTNYESGEQLNLDGITVTAHYNSGTLRDVTEQATFSPENGTTLSSSGTVEITASYTEGDITKTALTSVTVEDELQIVTWSEGTDAQIAAMLDAHYAGDINIHDYWKVGDERTVHLNAMPAEYVSESHAEQDVTMVLMNAGGKTLVEPINGKQECAFVVGQKNCLNSSGNTYMNQYNSENVGGWDACKRRTWCNNTYRNALPSTLVNIFKQHNNITANGVGSTAVTSCDYFTLPSEKEVMGDVIYADATAESENRHFEYYMTSANRTKYYANYTSGIRWWFRSPHSTDIGYFVGYYKGIYKGTNLANGFKVAPQGCI